MKIVAQVTPTVLACVLLAAHFLRSFTWVGVLAALALPLLLLARRALRRTKTG